MLWQSMNHFNKINKMFAQIVFLCVVNFFGDNHAKILFLKDVDDSFKPKPITIQILVPIKINLFHFHRNESTYLLLRNVSTFDFNGNSTFSGIILLAIKPWYTVRYFLQLIVRACCFRALIYFNDCSTCPFPDLISIPF